MASANRRSADFMDIRRLEQGYASSVYTRYFKSDEKVG